MKFLSVRTWDKVRDYIRFHDDMGHLWDERMRRCDTERVGRVVNHFQNDDNAYFMVINAPNTEVHLITGEIGICSLLTGQRGILNYQESVIKQVKETWCCSLMKSCQ